MPINSDFLIKHIRPADIEAVEVMFCPTFQSYLRDELRLSRNDVIELARAWIAIAGSDPVTNSDRFVAAADAVSRGRWTEHSATSVNTVFFLNRSQLVALSNAGNAGNASRQDFPVDFSHDPIAAAVDMRAGGGHHIRWSVGTMIVTADAAGNICHLPPQMPPIRASEPLAQAAPSFVAADPATAGLNAVIDLSHNNGRLTTKDFEAAKASGIRAVFHKATQGGTFADPMLVPHLTAARQVGLLVGAYHFGTSADPATQFAFFSDTVRRAGLGPMPLVLDFEANVTPATSMTVEQAGSFLQQARKSFGKALGLYSGATIRDALGATRNPIFAESWLWLPSYGTNPTTQNSWDHWTFWQYTDGRFGPAPHQIPGLSVTVDRSVFRGSETELVSFWNTAAVALG